MKRLKRVVLKEELVALTGDYTDAIILQQFIYWSERVADFDKFIEEEKRRANMDGFDIEFDLTNGWIYKTCEEMSEESLTGLAKSNMRNHIKRLVENNWLEERRNPKYRFDKTYQYRVNLIKIACDLEDIGYTLEGYRYDVFALKNDQNSESNNRSTQNETPRTELNLAELNRSQQNQNETAIPEITTEITTEITIKKDNQSINQEDPTLEEIFEQSRVDTFEDEDVKETIKEAIRELHTDTATRHIIKRVKAEHILDANTRYSQERLTMKSISNPMEYYKKILINCINSGGFDKLF